MGVGGRGRAPSSSQPCSKPGIDRFNVTKALAKKTELHFPVLLTPHYRLTLHPTSGPGPEAIENRKHNSLSCGLLPFVKPSPTLLYFVVAALKDLLRV